MTNQIFAILLFACSPVETPCTVERATYGMSTGIVVNGADSKTPCRDILRKQILNLLDEMGEGLVVHFNCAPKDYR